MKKIVFALACFFGMAEANAQFQGPVTVRNLTDCDVCVSVYAACPDGTHHFSNFNFCFGPQETEMIFNGYGWGPISAEPFTPPPCDGWEWQCAVVQTYGGVGGTWVTGAVGWDGTTYAIPAEVFPDGSIENNVRVDLAGMGITCGNGTSVSINWALDPSTGSVYIIIF